MITVFKKNSSLNAKIKLPASKSISNRLLIIQYLAKHKFEIQNLSVANDTVFLTDAIQQINKTNLINCGEGGTSYRFLTALLAITEGNFELFGHQHLMQRPIALLVDALNTLGAAITYKNNTGNGPLLITGKKIEGGHLAIDGNVSSQFISALLLVAPYFEKGIILKLNTEPVSKDYIIMTIKLMQNFGAQVEWEGSTIEVKAGNYHTNESEFTVESDWSAASYWYSMAAMANDVDVTLYGLNETSLQGDSIIAAMMHLYGVKTIFTSAGVQLVRNKNRGVITGFDFADCPDLVQTFAFLNAALRAPLQVNNAANLRLKETDRINALSTELQKLGVQVQIENDNSVFFSFPYEYNQALYVDTYNDHRMAMSPLPLAFCVDTLVIENEKAVSKSYPDFWKHLQAAGFNIA